MKNRGGDVNWASLLASVERTTRDSAPVTLPKLAFMGEAELPRWLKAAIAKANE